MSRLFFLLSAGIISICGLLKAHWCLLKIWPDRQIYEQMQQRAMDMFHQQSNVEALQKSIEAGMKAQAANRRQRVQGSYDYESTSTNFSSIFWKQFYAGCMIANILHMLSGSFELFSGSTHGPDIKKHSGHVTVFEIHSIPFEFMG